MRYLLAFTVCALLLGLACVDIVEVDQPKEVNKNATFDVTLKGSVLSDSTADPEEAEYRGTLAVQIPVDWKVISATYEGDHSGTFEENKRVAGHMELEQAASSGFAWVGFLTRESIAIDDPGKGYEYTVKLKLKAGKTSGNYMIDYRLGINEGGGTEITNSSITWGGNNADVQTTKVK